MNTIPRLRIIWAVLLAVGIAGLIYGLYQRSNAEQERLRQDSHRIETMLTEDNVERP